MTSAVRIDVPGTGRAPEVRLLDARRAGLDEAGLRAWARAVTDAAGGTHLSRSYRHPYCLVAWHADRVGVDIERAECLDAAFLSSIATPSERADRAPAFSDPDRRAASLWCAKEALAKALGDALAYDPRRLESPSRWPAGRAGPWRASPLGAAPQHVAWLCWRDTRPPASASPSRR